MQTSPFISELGNFKPLQGPLHLCSQMEISVRDVSVGLVADVLYLGLVVLCGCLVLKCFVLKLSYKLLIAKLAKKHGLIDIQLKRSVRTSRWVLFSRPSGCNLGLA